MPSAYSMQVVSKESRAGPDRPEQVVSRQLGLPWAVLMAKPASIKVCFFAPLKKAKQGQSRSASTPSSLPWTVLMAKATSRRRTVLEIMVRFAAAAPAGQGHSGWQRARSRRCSVRFDRVEV